MLEDAAAAIRGNGFEDMAKGQVNAAFKAQLIIPEHRQLYEYWLLKAAGRPMPDKRDISPAHIPRLLPNVSLIEVEMPGERYRVRLAGTRLRDVHDCETTGLYLDDLDWGDKRDYWLAAYHRIAEEGKPAQIFAAPQHKLTRDLVAARLPDVGAA